MEICEAENVDVIIPLFSDELFSLYARKDEIKAKILVSNVEALKIGSDKGLLQKFLEDNNLVSSRSFMPANIDELKKAVLDLGYPSNEVVVKPRQTSGSRGFHIIKEDIDEADIFFNQKPDVPFRKLDDMLG